MVIANLKIRRDPSLAIKVGLWVASYTLKSTIYA